MASANCTDVLMELYGGRAKGGGASLRRIINPLVLLAGGGGRRLKSVIRLSENI